MANGKSNSIRLEQLEEQKEIWVKENEKLTLENKELQVKIDNQKKQFIDRDLQIDELKKRIHEEVLSRTNELHRALEGSEESNKLKTIFLEKIGREIRTPLNAILGFINLLGDPDINNRDREYYLKFIRESGNNLLNLIDNIVDFTKVETGELKVEFRKCNLDLLISDLIEKYKNRLVREKTPITLLFKNNTDGQESMADCKRILNILDQLISNAIKYTKKGAIEVNYSISDNNHLFQVKDSGIGIDKNYQDIIFERFYQIEPESRDAFKGAGLGLTISKALVDMMKGEIWIESIPDEGSSFYFTVPFRKISSAKLQNNNTADINWINKTVLIAEDEDSNYFFLEAILKKTKINLLRANDGVEFLEIMDNNMNIDIVLLDIKMPGINGFNAIKVVRQQNIAIPVIAQTAFNQAEDKQKCLDSGCNDYLAKPIDKDLLIAKMMRYLS